MCGLVAIFNYYSSPEPVNQEELLRIRDAMINRGPDNGGLWVSKDKSIGLAHRRLAIIDLSKDGNQPMFSKDNSLSIVFNGEIYNFVELRQMLVNQGYQFSSNSDTEVLLCLYQAYGTEMVNYLRGMYAFVIWDTCKSGVFLARDPFGIKPLYYADNGKTIRVASQVKALIKGNGIDTGLEPAGYVGFYLWGHVPEPYTLYRGVRALPAGTSLWVDTSGKKKINKFFNLTTEYSLATNSDISNEERQERLYSALLSTMKHHQISDVPVGIFLSAGIDSSLLVALSRDLGKSSDIRTLTIGFDELKGTTNDEVPIAELVAKKYNTSHQTCWVRKQDFYSEYDHLLESMDQPSIDGVNSYFVSKAAADMGIKVAISGLGGDELLGGYPSFKDIPHMVNAVSPIHSNVNFCKVFRYVSAPILKHFTSPKYAGMLEYGGTYGGAYLLRRGLYMPWELPSLMDGEIVKQGWADLQTLISLEATTQGINSEFLKVSALEVSWYMRNQLLRDSDWASMAHSLELRLPFVDIELFKTLMGLFSSKHPITKQDIISSLLMPLPNAVTDRKKTGFSVPVQQWLMSQSIRQKSSSLRGLRAWADVVMTSSLES